MPVKLQRRRRLHMALKVRSSESAATKRQRQRQDSRRSVWRKRKKVHQLARLKQPRKEKNEKSVQL